MTADDLSQPERYYKTISLPTIPGSPWPTIAGLWPMPEAEWDRMMVILAAMQPALVYVAELEIVAKEGTA